MKFIELFAGLGGMGKGLMDAGMECVGYVEIDKYAHKAFQILHDPEERLWNAYDVRGVTDDDIRLLGEQHNISLIAAGFPCQSFSIAGKREGFADRTRGTLFFEIIRYAEILKPKYLLLENVKGLLNHDGGRTYATILCALDELGFDCEWQLLNSKNFGVPQNRERVFIVGHSRTGSGRKIFPISGENSEVDCNLAGKLALPGKDQWNRVYHTDGIAPTLTTMQGGRQEPKVLLVGNTNPSGNGMNGNVFDSNGLAPTLTTNKGEGNKILVNVSQKTGVVETEKSLCLDANYFKGLGANQARTGVMEPRPVLTPDRVEKRQNGRRFKEPGEPMFTLTAQDKHGVAIWRGSKNGNAEETDTKEVMQALREGNGSGEIQQRETDGTPTLRQEGILQQELYEDGVCWSEGDRETNIQNCTCSSEKNNESSEMRSLRIKGKLGHTPQGRELEEQRTGELTECLSELPHSDSQGKNMQHMSEQTQRTRVLRETLSKVQEVRESVSDKTNWRIRKLTPLEAFRLQSFPDEWYYTLKKAGISDSQLYKMAGNAVTSVVAYEIGRRLMDGATVSDCL